MEKRAILAFVGIFFVITLLFLTAKPTLVWAAEEFGDTSHLKNVKFKIIDEATSQPLSNRELNICQFVYFKLKPDAPSPYLDKGGDWFITSIKTDGQGIFFLDLSKIEASDLVVEPGPPYNIVRFERSSDLAHTKSADHIRVVQFETGTTRVISNMIYDLKNKKVSRIYPPECALAVPYVQILLTAKRVESTDHSDVQLEPDNKEFAKTLCWVDEQTGQKLFDVGDIVRFDWDKQIFELRRSVAMNFMAELGSVGVYGRKFVLKYGHSVIYRGTLVTPASSIAFMEPVIRGTIPDDNVEPPLFEIGGGYPRDFEKGDTRFSERLKKALEQANLLGEIDINNPPPPIETITHGWFGEKGGLRILIEVFQETLRLHRSARVHIHLTGGKDLDENYVFDVNATLTSQDGKPGFTMKKAFPFHRSGWKTVYVLEMNPWTDTEDSSSAVKPGRAKLIIEVSTRKILDKGTTKYSEPIDRGITDAIGVWIETGQPLLPETPNKVMTYFQKAIKASDWVKALECCSNKIKSKVEGYDSKETFFKDVLPIDEIAALSEFPVSGRGYHNDEVIRYSCEIKLKDPNYRWPLDWNLSVLKDDSNWVVEFPTKPLDIWLKHKILKMKAANDQLLLTEKNRAGFEISLIPLTKEFTIGSPILFRVEMKNINNETLGYTHTSFMVNDPMLIKDFNGATVPYVDTSYQTLVAPEFVEPGETVILADTYDVRSQYHITNPGKYTFQFRGYSIGTSNSVEVDIKPGELSALESIVEKLMPVLPEGWRLTRSGRDGIWINLIGKARRKGTDRGIGLFLYINPGKSNLRGEFLGQTKWGPVYVESLDAELLWPNYKEQITKTLGI